MIFLKKIYSNPIDLFEPTEFVDGVNFVFGKKDKKTDPKISLNGIGKSTFLDLIDFCLLSSFNNEHNPRLYSAKEFLDGYEINLELEIDGKDYVLSRDFLKPNEVKFGILGQKLETFQIDDLKEKLFALFFTNETYIGKVNPKWFRKLIPFFVKIHKPKKDKFTDPVSYMPNTSVAELMQYHFFLLGLDNTISHRNYEVQAELKKKDPTIKEVKTLIEDLYGLKDFSQVANQITKIKTEVVSLEKAVETFKLTDVYEDVEEKANKITDSIKDLIYQNFTDRRKISSYEDSFRLKTEIDVKKIKRIYKELNESLAISVQKTLEQAIEFRTKLSEARQDFIQKEINNIKKIINTREQSIQTLERERSDLFTFLANKEAIKDLTEAFHIISQKKSVLHDLEGKIKIYEDLEKERAELKIVEKTLEKEMLDFLTNIKSSIEEVRMIFSEIYNAIYPENKDQSIFDILYKPTFDAKTQITISFPAMKSKGKNQGRTLIYDLCLLFNGIKNNFRQPRFLIHDGVFDGMDKAHFVALYNYLENLKNKGVRFQYIIAINEEGTLGEKFGDTDKLTTESIEDQAIITLTPNKKLFGRTFD